MTKKPARPAIRSNRSEPELPILERLAPIETPRPRPEPPGERPRLASAPDRPPMPDPFAAGSSGRGPISINHEPLQYGAQPLGRSRRRRLLSAILPIGALALVVGTVAAAPEAGAAASDQNAAPTAVDVKSVRFDLPDDQGSSTRYRSAVVTAAGVEYRLAPMAGSVRVTMTEPDAAAMTVDADGAVVGPTDAGFADAVADAIGSPSVSRVLQLGRTAAGEAPSLTVFFDRPLGPGDHLLVQESGGDGTLSVTPVDGAGGSTGLAVTVGPGGIGHDVDTGQRTATGAAAWGTVVPVAGLDPAGGSAAGIRVTGADVQVKVVPMIAAPEPVAPQPDGAQLGDGSAPVYASVGLEAMIQPTMAIDGAGCLSAPAAPVSVGQAVTFCYVVTNQGSTHLTDIRITDPQLGLTDAVLPVASGPAQLAPGQEAVLYHHAVAGSRSPQLDSIVTARPVDAAGHPIVNLIAPSGVGAPGSIGGEGAPPALDGAGSAVAAPGDGAEMIEVPAVRAVDETPTAPVVTAPPSTAAAPSSAAPTEADVEPPTQLAMTGLPTEPWTLAALAVGLIFIGHTTYLAFAPAATLGATGGHRSTTRSRRRHRGDPDGGHALLDALGFDD
ncbi:MAG: hypothetical protein AAF547_22905 [Actinomycetota bacterium]